MEVLCAGWHEYLDNILKVLYKTYDTETKPPNAVRNF